MAEDITSTAYTSSKLVATPPPPEGSPMVGEWVWAQFEVCRQHKERGNWHSKWLRNHELRRGRHFKHRNPEKSKVPLVPVNLFHVAHSTTVANLTDNKPKFDIIPHDETSKPMVPIMHRAASMWWKRTGQQKTFSNSISNGEEYGTTVEKMYFDFTLEGGMGDIDCAVVDSFKFFPWPDVKEIQRMPRFAEIDVLSLEEIKQTWPETGKKVKADREFSGLIGKERQDVRGGSLTQSTFSGHLPNNYSTGDGVDSGTQLIEQAMVVELWTKDYTMVPIMEPRPVVDSFGNAVMGEVKVGEKAKYPGNIRVIHVTNSGDNVLDDMPNPSVNPNLPEEQTSGTYLFDKYPYQKADSNHDSTNFWSFSIIEQIEVLVLELNKKISQIAAYIDKTARPTLIDPANSGIKSRDRSNLPGQVWRPTNHVISQFIRYLDMPPLPRDFYKYIELLLRLVDIITGIHEVTEGRKPAGVTAATAIIALQEKAQTIFREKIRNYDMLIEGRGRMYISLSQNWLTNQRKLQMSGHDAAVYGEFLEYNGTEFIGGEFTFEVVPGSTMPKSVYVRREQGVQLYQAGAIDQREILDLFDWPNIEEVIQRMSQGPLGQLIERLQTAGMPEEVLAAVQYVGSLDANEFKKEFEQQPKPLGGTSVAATQARSKE